MKRMLFVIICGLVFVTKSNANELVDDVVELAGQHPIKACLIQTDKIGLITSVSGIFSDNKCQYGEYSVRCINKVLYYSTTNISTPVVDNLTLQFVRCQNIKLSNKIVKKEVVR
jgi:hypothetical protein